MPTPNALNSSCVVLVPYTGAIVTECDIALQVLESRGYVVRRTPGYSAIDVARNEMAFKALEDGFREGFIPTETRAYTGEISFIYGNSASDSVYNYDSQSC